MTGPICTRCRNGETLAAQDEISHTLRITDLQRILYKVMADNNLDALVYVYAGVCGTLRLSEPCRRGV